MQTSTIRSVAIIGAGAAGAAAAVAFAAEEYFEKIRVFERRESAGGTWIYDPDPSPTIKPQPGKLPPDHDLPLNIPKHLPTTREHSYQERYEKTPIYNELTTNVPAIAMSLSDMPFPYGPFVPHHVPKQYIENYFSTHEVDKYLVLNTTVEDVSRDYDRWLLTLRQYHAAEQVDHWWKEEFDAVILANGHYSVPYIPAVEGLEAYVEKYPDRVIHSKSYRSAENFRGRKVLVIGNSASGHDITLGAVKTASLPVYQSRRSSSHWDGNKPDPGIVWKPTVKEYLPTGEIIFEDGTVLDDVDVVIYCTGYKASFPFWNASANGGPIFDYKQDRLIGNYLHTFLIDQPSLGIVGIPRTLTFRSFNYQAIALARVFSGRNARPLPTKAKQREWEAQRWEFVHSKHRKFHDISWDDGETMNYFRELYEIAGLPRIEGQGSTPPVMDAATRWAIENVKKYPAHGDDEGEGHSSKLGDSWAVVERRHCRDSLHFI
ncbi:putative dimethylaniline monooxygenase [Talaromyces proteolyticus]|uniref:Dimethylaniline monooxygenase n=1 Tax=Talaromyces proteolyticus TaxID=1131652 RepID=A0AAD4KU79_9EURO|nr:putative dimethylaniline monooxygenase [Talaromyces proteolyticus]KAH8700105.1 putative dimethylaniline monooxygenase [Talaromyces proteolyticus]